MKLSRHIFLLLVCFLFHTTTLLAQPGFKVDIEKPAPYKERKLKAERTGDGKLKTHKRILQNLTTRYNYVFNANNKFNEIIDRAREQHKDDYTRLLSFYNYDLNATAADSAQLDSVIYKARTGILNHDLRNEWIDELYLLWGASFHLRKSFDSASMMLQFINYAYAPQFEDGYYKHIGTNADGARELSIVTKEEKKFLHSNTFSRNNAFLWQIRTQIELENMTRAGSLITTLKRDPVFPKRLQNWLDEVEAYWYYRQQQWDSAAVHLLAALDGDYPRQEKSRWHYLAAQMMERAGKSGEAARVYAKVVAMSNDPVMEVHARLNVVRLGREGGEDATDKNLAELLKMAKRDKYEEYRDIIYYMAAQMELERGNIAAASELLIKGAKANNGDQASKNKAFLQIADVSFDQKKYLQAASFYDSVQVTDLAEADAARVSSRKTALLKVVKNTDIITRQDSLQRIAALPEQEREALLKSLVKKLRKQQGLKDDASITGGSSMPGGSTSAAPVDLFASQQKGEWYFYNQASKTQGGAQFKSVWGNRPNVDNWRRFAAVSQQLLSQPDKVEDVADPNAPAGAAAATSGSDLSVAGLTSRLPLTEETMQASNDSIREALFALGTAYLNDVEDYASAIATFEEMRRRFPENDKIDQVLFNLSYAYSKTGNATAAAQLKKLLTEKFPASRFSAIASTGKDPLAKTLLSPEATRAYEDVYNLFIEGRFAEAETAKRIADSTYKTNFWQPQLLYIESVYYIKQRQDSVAKSVLQTIVNQNTNKVLTAKAQNLMNVLGRRQQIEDELTRLQITRPSDDDSTASQPVALQQKPVVVDTVVSKPVVQPQKDTIAVVKKPEVKPLKDTVVAKAVPDPAIEAAKEAAALAKARQKQVSDSISLSKLNAKRLLDSLTTARKDSIALAKKQAADALRDSLAKKAVADSERRDSIALAKKQAADALRESLAKKAVADRERRDSIALAKAAREQVRQDSIALSLAMRKQATDAAALQKYYAKRLTDSLARITRDSVALVKKQAAQARADSLERKLNADKQQKEAAALLEKQRRDSIALADKQRKDSIALADKQRRDSIALAKAASDLARKDSLAQRQALLKQQRDSVALARLTAKAIRDSLARIKPPEPEVRKPVADPNTYNFNPAEAHMAVIVMDKVDPIFVSEARTAFLRYNKEYYYDQPLDVQIVNISADTRLLVVSGLPTASVAVEYASKAKSVAASEIIPWLTGNKYSFTIISVPNLNLLKVKTDINAYKKFLEQHLPGRF